MSAGGPGLQLAGAGTVVEVGHPLVAHKLGLLRDVNTDTEMFRRLVNELTLLLSYEATKEMGLEEIEVETPLERTPAQRIPGKKVAVCPILRAGMGMLDGVLSLIPVARVGFIGLYRNEETLEPVEYYVKLPADIAERDVLLLDPMLATGNSTAPPSTSLKRAGASQISLISLIAAPEGIERIAARPPGRAHLRRLDRLPPERARAISSPAWAMREIASTGRSKARSGLARAHPPPEVVWGALVALGIVVLLTPAVGGMARLLGVVDRPEEGRRAKPVRASPGSAASRSSSGSSCRRSPSSTSTAQMRGILLGATIATTVGAIDDFRGLRWWEKLAGQIAAAAISAWSGVWVHSFTFPVLGVAALPRPVGIALTMFGIVAVMNMVNFLDGLDGLAAGVCAISALSFCVIDLSRGDVDAAILTAIVFGACLGFLRHNFYPARIFMGDSGALLLGFTLGGRLGPGPLEDGGPDGARPAAARARDPADRHLLRRRQADQARPPDLRRRPHPPPPPLRDHRLLAAPLGHLPLPLVRALALAALATRFVHPHPHGRLEPGPVHVAIDAAIGAARARRLGVRRLPARDRQAREPVHPPPAEAGRERSGRKTA